MHISSVTPYNCSFSSGMSTPWSTRTPRWRRCLPDIFLFSHSHRFYLLMSRKKNASGPRWQQPTWKWKWTSQRMKWKQQRRRRRCKKNTTNCAATEALRQHDGLIAHKQFHSWTATTGNNYIGITVFFLVLLCCQACVCVSALIQLAATGAISLLPYSSIKENEEKTSCDWETVQRISQMEWLRPKTDEKNDPARVRIVPLPQWILFIRAIFVRASASP